MRFVGLSYELFMLATKKLLQNRDDYVVKRKVILYWRTYY